MRRESELTKPPDVTVVDNKHGKWFLVVDAAEGFHPQATAIKASTPERAKSVWRRLDRNQGVAMARVHADEMDRTR